ncbi:molybdopterin biosynthesis protein [Octadecabacter sp. 1_MG-2023]|uniref:molybdopterin biosynthesis protein n=1 Tax=unclassified Octadecabacter TaxID=196158 RepID=UPI001C08317A|nr:MULTISPECIES: molybdopterin biosynthesis protein [unclassified Octadecabacter]MBU2993103.1 molybdopterin biosynthesis protein [Octadecabacter sp. B2R22]MDO6733445.1 molybdopterin biosynthesis protein [Octadecabacter sp. 1_MG-2023]
MRFGDVPLAEAAGAILAHGVPIASLSKGIVLGDGHLETLAAFGLHRVSVVRRDDDDIPENDAACRLAEALVPNPDRAGLYLSKVNQGTITIRAHRAGLLELDAKRLTALNRIEPRIALATLPKLHRVSAGVVVANISVMSYGVRRDSLDQACDAVAGTTPAMKVRPAELTRATLIETHHAGARHHPNGRRSLDERLDRLGCSLQEVVDIPHDTPAAITDALTRAKGEVIFLLTAAATLDEHDVAPSALRAAGGEVLHFGMPVNPGHLLFTGHIRDVPVIGLPTCARALGVSGADFVLERILCGLPCNGDVIAAMGVGGLLSTMPEINND